MFDAISTQHEPQPNLCSIDKQFYQTSNIYIFTFFHPQYFAKAKWLRLKNQLKQVNQKFLNCWNMVIYICHSQLLKRIITRAPPLGFPPCSGYISPYIPPLVIIQIQSEARDDNQGGIAVFKVLCLFVTVITVYPLIWAIVTGPLSWKSNGPMEAIMISVWLSDSLLTTDFCT